MDSLPEEIFVSVVLSLDGDAYLALSCVSHSLQEVLNEKCLLEQVTQANVPGAEVVDAAYYAYSYSQRYLTTRALHNKDSFYEVLKRTLHEGRLTPTALRTLKKRVVSLMSAYLKFIDARSADELKSIHRRIREQVPDVAREIHAFFYAYTKEVLDVTKFPKPLYLQKAKEGNLRWFEEGGEVGHPFSALFQAVRYGHHNVVRFLAANSTVSDFSLSLSSFFGLPLDGEMMRLLLAMEAKHGRETVRRASVAGLVQDDRAEAFDVLLSSRSLKADDLKYYLRVAIQADALGCFRALAHYIPSVESKLEVRNLVIRNKSYRIWKYYRMEKGFADDLFAVVLGSSVTSY